MHFPLTLRSRLQGGVSKGGRLDCCTMKCVAGQLGCQGRQDGGRFDTVWSGEWVRRNRLRLREIFWLDARDVGDDFPGDAVVMHLAGVFKPGGSYAFLQTFLSAYLDSLG